MPLEPKSQEFVPTSEDDDSEASDVEEQKKKKKQSKENKKKEVKKVSEKRKAKDEEDSAEEEPKKKTKSTKEIQTDKDGKKYWPLTKTRRVGINEFKGKTFVDIREFYEKDGEMLPGRKGISLSIDQWKILCSLTDDINGELK